MFYRGIMPKIIMTMNFSDLKRGQEISAFDGDDAVDCQKANSWIVRKEGRNRDGLPQYFLLPKKYAEERIQ
jgi:hypothetical protein